ncbi:MAG: geranylgeranyl reductase family protein [Ignavibacterium sp.]|nr:MAG: geranylgeranyl reductase family protein [Ignavibacterium sp.]
MIYDAIIIGSGVAGTSAAYFLVKGGKNVLLLEKERLPRYKTCGGGVISRISDILPYEIEPVVDVKMFTADIFDHENNISFHVKRDEPIINMTMRESLDYFMLEKAREENAIFKSEEIVTDINQNSEYVEVVTEMGKYNARFVIAADGASGITVRKLGLQNNYKKIPALENEVYVENNQYEEHSKTARFDFGFVPAGYAWVFPKKEHLSIGLFTMNGSNVSLRKYLNEFITKLGIKDIKEEKKHGYFLPLYKKSEFTKGRILLVGDAAGLTDPITGEGISYAIESGKCAAEAIVHGSNDVDTVIKNYQKNLKGIVTELRYAKFLALFVYASPKLRKFAFKRYGKKLSELMTDVITGRNKYSKLMKDPLNYLKLFRSAKSLSQ